MCAIKCVRTIKRCGEPSRSIEKPLLLKTASVLFRGLIIIIYKIYDELIYYGVIDVVI
jgi:hypothetical protein